MFCGGVVMTKKSAKLEESKELEELAERYKKKIGNVDTIDKFLEKYNPWREKNPEEENTQRKGKDIDELLDDFFEALKNDNKEFSWLKIDEDLYNELKDKNGRAASIDYGVPSHVRGDIENGTLFLCLVNPNIDVKVAMCEACQMKNEEDIKKYIFDPSDEGGVLYKEINKNGIEKPGYYTAKYLNGLLKIINDSENVENNENSIDYKEISKKIINLEAFPFRSSSPGFARKTTKDYKNRFANCLVKSTSNVSMLSARIIIWKILKYINSDKKDKVKPVFIFRRFNQAWKPSITNVLKEDYKVGKDKIETIFDELHNKYFYTLRHLDNDNFSEITKNSIYKNNKKISTKKAKYDEFKTLLKNALSL